MNAGRRVALLAVHMRWLQLIEVVTAGEEDGTLVDLADWWVQVVAAGDEVEGCTLMYLAD